MRTTTRYTTALAALTLGLTAACGTSSDPDSGDDSDGGTENATLTVGATAVPHAEILQFVADNLAEDAGLDLDIREFDDYLLPNTALEDGEVDANFFQHGPFLEEHNATHGTSIVPVTDVHLEPLGLYSATVEDVAELGAGDEIAIPDDATNGGRGLLLLAEHGVIELADGVGAEATIADITDDGGLEFTEMEAPTLHRVLDDVDAAVINGNYALEADLVPAEDAIALEDAEDNPYVNFTATREGDEDDPRLETLGELLTSDEVHDYIEERYEGSVIPAP